MGGLHKWIDQVDVTFVLRERKSSENASLPLSSLPALPPEREEIGEDDIPDDGGARFCLAPANARQKKEAAAVHRLICINCDDTTTAGASHFANYSLSRYRPRNTKEAEIFMAVINPASPASSYK